MMLPNSPSSAITWNVPVRTYSTGMLLRLAFAIATVRDPEILLLDEVVGVGDAAFFAKAFDRLQDIHPSIANSFLASHADNIYARFAIRRYGSIRAISCDMETLRACLRRTGVEVK